MYEPFTKIEPLDVDHPDYDRVLADADQIIKDYNNYGPSIINGVFMQRVLIAMVTWKKIAEERQEELDHLGNIAWEEGE